MHPLSVLTLLTLAVITPIAEAAPCQEPDLSSVSSTHPECHFYKGTRHYRSREYAAARREWQAVININDIPKEFEHVRIDAQNNLGFLYYMGWGVKQDTRRAIQQYWLPAEKSGHKEAAYHLCHAYADKKSKRALGYCREALRRYGAAGQSGGDHSEIVAQLQSYISSFEAGR